MPGTVPQVGGRERWAPKQGRQCRRGAEPATAGPRGQVGEPARRPAELAPARGPPSITGALPGGEQQSSRTPAAPENCSHNVPDACTGPARGDAGDRSGSPWNRKRRRAGVFRKDSATEGRSESVPQHTAARTRSRWANRVRWGEGVAPAWPGAQLRPTVGQGLHVPHLSSLLGPRGQTWKADPNLTLSTQ